MKFGNYLRYGFRDTFRSLWRHKGMVAVTLLTVAVSMLVLGAAVLFSLNSQHIANNMEDQLEIAVFLDVNLSREDAQALEASIQAVPGFKSMRFVPKEDALVDMGGRFGGEDHLSNALGGLNPLPDVYNIKIETPEQIPAAVKVLEKLGGVEMVRYGQDQDLVNKVVVFSDTVQVGCIAIIVAMIIAALFLVNSTIRLTVSARSDEIAIMKYVGATNFYVRIPFFIEGLVLGILGALLSVAALYFGYQSLLEYMTANVTFIQLIEDNKLLLEICGVLLLGGTLLGAIGSNIAVKKYLKV